jgi:hypothetical protein
MIAKADIVRIRPERFIATESKLPNILSLQQSKVLGDTALSITNEAYPIYG